MTVSRVHRVSIGICLALIFGITALWLRGLFAKDAVYWFSRGGRQVSLVSCPHHLFISSEASGKMWTAARTATAWGDKSIPPRMHYLEFRFGHYQGDWALWLPHWLPLLLLSAAPAWMFFRRRRYRDRQTLGLCSQCGYDLRASGDRCSECGAPRDEAKAAVISVGNANNSRAATS